VGLQREVRWQGGRKGQGGGRTIQGERRIRKRQEREGGSQQQYRAAKEERGK
jgi:hypothetical protein